MRTEMKQCRERGQTIVLVAVMLTVLLGLTAIAVDLGYVFVQRRNMQNAADAAALAGARMVALFEANPTISYRYRDLYDETMRAAQANEALDINAYLVDCETGEPTYEVRATDYRTIDRGYCACGVAVRAETTFRPWLSSLFGIRELTASAEARAEFGLPKSVRGVAPIGLRDTVLKQGPNGMVGSEYTMWDSKKEGGANRGWLGLDCTYPEKSSACSPDSNSLKAWMNPPYYTGEVKEGDMFGGDPGVRTSILHEAEIGEELIIPVYDYVYHFTNSRHCNPKDPKYNWSQCKAEEMYEGTIPVYTDDPGYNGKYYYHTIAFALFRVTGKGQQGGDKYLRGIFDSYVTPGDWKKSECLQYSSGNDKSFGLAVIKLTR